MKPKSLKKYPSSIRTLQNKTLFVFRFQTSSGSNRLKNRQERAQARRDKNFKRADKIRNALLQVGIVLKDRLNGTTEWGLK